MTEERVKRKLSAILSADVAGYSRLMGEDEVSTVRTLEAYRKVMSDLIEQFRGRVVDSPGDNLLSEFSSVVDAVQCAVEIHEVIRAKNEELPEDRRMLFRIGVNLGDVIEEGDRIYGDGVNIAARLEGLAEPGGICISGTAHEHIENKLALGYEFLGEHTVKNITKPVKVYRVPMGPKSAISKEGKEKETTLKNWQGIALGAAGTIIVIIGALAVWNFCFRGPSIEPASVKRMAYPLPDKSSIAVLPFTNMSGDSEQDYIGDGLSENIISALSVSSEIFVIARNTTFTYKEKAVDIKQVAEDLGVQYILEGSIQKSGNQLRVTAQLIDALSGHHLWSEVYDREMRNLFDLQDEITKKIMVSLQAELTWVGEDARLFAKSTDNLEAWKHYVKGDELYNNFIEEDNAKAREHLETALELDPQYVSAMSLLGWTHLWDSLMGWSDSPSASINRAFNLAQKAVELDERDPFVHGLLGYISLQQGQYEKAIFEGKQAITLNPNFALGHGVLGYILLHCGQFDEAITMMKKGYRLNPNLPSVLLIILARNYIFLEHYEKALELCDEMEEHVLNNRLGEFKFVPPLYSSWVYQELGREEEARAYMAEALKRNPDYSVERAKILCPYKNPAHLQRQLDAYRKAGMPEKPPGAVQEKPSIAVLPFDDLSPEKDQEYFVLGLSEEILSSLCQISDLTVIAKTSSFSFKGKDKTIQEIASVLDVDHILEGSVRKAGNAIRITAQLIKTYDESHLWSETYDREFKVQEVFSIQEDIASNVAAELKVSLGIGTSLKQLGGTDSEEAYQHYLVAQGIIRQLLAVSSKENYLSYEQLALKSIDAAITLDPHYALAHVLKASIHNAITTVTTSTQTALEHDYALQETERAIALQPDLAEAHAELGDCKSNRGDWIGAEVAHRKSLELKNVQLLENSSIYYHYQAVGHLKTANSFLEVMRKNDPYNPTVRTFYILNLGSLGDMRSAEEEYERCIKLFGEFFSPWSITYIRLEGYDVLTRDKILDSDLIDDVAKEYLDSPEKGLAELRRIYSENKNLIGTNFVDISLWAAFFGDPEFALDALQKGINVGSSWTVSFVWLPHMRVVRQLPRFKEFVREIGLVDYWNQFGWPDLCHQVGEDDFECD